MCDPVSLAVAAVVSTAGSLITEVQSAKAQKRAIADQLALQEAEINTATTAEMNDRARATRREQARIKVAAGESGVQLGSGTIEALLLDSVTQQQLAAERGGLNNDTQLHAARAEANSMYSRVSQPTVLGAGLRLGTAAVQGYASGSNLQIARKGISAKAAASAS